MAGKAVAVVLAALALAVPGAKVSLASREAASKLHVVLEEHESYSNASGRNTSTFVLRGAAGTDSGAGGVRFGVRSTPRVRDGQSFTTLRGTDTLHGKTGGVTLSFVGIEVGAGGDVFVNYGTWRILPGTGTGPYKGWTGSGRWAAAVRPTAAGYSYSYGWEGLVTR